MVVGISRQSVTCNNCGYTFHNNMGVDRCPRCRTMITTSNSNQAQSSTISQKDIENINKILEFASNRKHE